MPDPLAPADPGLLSSILDTARLPGFALRNLIKGNLGGAGRNLVDLAGRGLDAALPGDWIPDVSTAEDRPEFKDVFDLGGDNLGTDILNFAGDVATDPVSYIPGAAFAKAGNLAKAGIGKVVSKLPEAIQTPLREGAATIGRNVRSVAGAQRVSPETTSALLGKQAASDLVSRTGSEATVNALSGLTPKEQLAVGQAGHNLRLDPVTGRPVSVLDESGTMTMDQRLQKLMAEDPELSPERLLKALPQVQGKLKAMWESGQEAATSPGGGIFFKNEAPATPDLLMGGYKTEANQGVQDYFPKQFSGLKADEIDEATGLPKNLPGQTPALGGAPAPVRERLDWQPKDILDYLAQNPKVNLEFDASKALAARDAAQAELAGRAQVGQSLFDRATSGQVPMSDELIRSINNRLPKDNNYKPVNMLGGSTAPEAAMAKQSPDVGAMLGGGTPRLPEHGPAPVVTDAERKSAQDYLKSNRFRYADPELRKAAQDIAKQFPAEEATVLLNALNGMGAPGGFVKTLNKLNRFFKPYAVYGAFIPKLGSITRNLTGGLAQQFAHADARGDTLRAAAQLVPNWLKSIDDGVEKLTGARFSKNEFQEVDNAYKAANGDPRKVAGFISDPTMREAVQKGVLGNTFVDTEHLISTVAKGGWKSFGKNLQDYPGAMFRGAEMRMRYGLFKAMRQKGKSADEAADIVSSSFYDYAVSSEGNRSARAAIPFFQFTAKALPQQAKLLAEKPLIASALANLQGGSSDQPLPPWMTGKANIPIGKDEQGNQQYLASLGLPVEALGWLPNPSADIGQFGRQVEQNQIGSLSPLLKTAFSVVSGEDPTFGTPFGAYSKVAGQDLGRPGAIINQLVGTGLPGASAIGGLLGMGAKASDPRASLGDKAINLLTGAKVTSVDPDVALQQNLQSYLENNPNVQQFRSFFQNSKDDTTQGLIEALAAAKARIKAKRAAILPVI